MAVSKVLRSAGDAVKGTQGRRNFAAESPFRCSDVALGDLIRRVERPAEARERVPILLLNHGLFSLAACLADANGVAIITSCTTLRGLPAGNRAPIQSLHLAMEA